MSEINQILKEKKDLMETVLKEKGFVMLSSERSGSLIDKNCLQNVPYEYGFDILFVTAVNPKDGKVNIIRIMHQDGIIKSYKDQNNVSHEFKPEFTGPMAQTFILYDDYLKSSKEVSLVTDDNLKDFCANIL